MMSDMLKQNNIKIRIQADGNVNKNTTRMLLKQVPQFSLEELQGYFWQVKVYKKI